MIALLAIDPGVDTGWAIFMQQRLYLCGLGMWPQAFLYEAEAIMERPQVYPRTRPKQANDLITLAIRVGQYKERIEARGAKVTLILPNKWKGSVPKPIHNQRVKDTLTPVELKILGAGDHNVIDAVGLGLYALNRLVP